MSLLLVLYGAGYGMARSQGILIHRITYVTEGGSKRYFHSVSTGDFGPGINEGTVLPLIVGGCYIVFTPLRWLESIAWSFNSAQTDNAA